MQQGSVGGAYASLIAPYLCGRKNLTQKIERYPGHPKWYKRFPVCKKPIKTICGYWYFSKATSPFQESKPCFYNNYSASCHSSHLDCAQNFYC